MAQIQAAAAAVAQGGMLTSFAVVAAANHYCMPLVDSSSVLSITEGRHPVVEDAEKTPCLSPTTPTWMTGMTCAPSSPAPIWRASPPICARWPSSSSWPRWAPLSRHAPPPSGWWTGCSPASGPGRPGRRTVHLHGGDERGGPAAENASRRSCSFWTRSDGGPPPMTAWPSPGRCWSTAPTAAAWGPRPSLPPTTTSSPSWRDRSPG